MIAEIDNSGNIVKSWIYGENGLEGVKDYSNNSTYIPVYDGNRNIVSYMSVGGGEVVAEYEYSPFGKEISVTGTKAGFFNFRYAGYFKDTETNLMYLGYRYFDSETGRFISRDRLGETGGINLYGYVRNNPVTYVDYLGMSPEDWSRYRKIHTKPIYCAGRAKANLKDLIRRINIDYHLHLNPEEDWKALWIYRRVKRDEYPNRLKKGALFDASSLVPKSLDYNKLVLSFYNPAEKFKYNFFAVQGIGMPIHAKNGEWVYEKIKIQSKQGARPISYFTLIGHGGSYDIIRSKNNRNKQFSINQFIEYAKRQYSGSSYRNAKNKIGPFRSWFAVNATARFWACFTNSFAANFAAHILRKNAVAYGTNSFQHWNPKHHRGEIGYDIGGRRVWFNNAKAAIAAHEVWTKITGGL